MTTPRDRSRNLSGLLATQEAGEVEARVDAALLAWVNRIINEKQLYERLFRLGIWQATDTRWEMTQALRGRLHQVLVQLREAEREHAAEGEAPCRASGLSDTRECQDRDRCGFHRAWGNRFLDLMVTFREVVMVTVPKLAEASVEATMRKRGL